MNDHEQNDELPLHVLCRNSAVQPALLRRLVSAASAEALDAAASVRLCCMMRVAIMRDRLLSHCLSLSHTHTCLLECGD